MTFSRGTNLITTFISDPIVCDRPFDRAFLFSLINTELVLSEIASTHADFPDNSSPMSRIQGREWRDDHARISESNYFKARRKILQLLFRKYQIYIKIEKYIFKIYL